MRWAGGWLDNQAQVSSVVQRPPCSIPQGPALGPRLLQVFLFSLYDGVQLTFSSFEDDGKQRGALQLPHPVHPALSREFGQHSGLYSMIP